MVAPAKQHEHREDFDHPPLPVQLRRGDAHEERGAEHEQDELRGTALPERDDDSDHRKADEHPCQGGRYRSAEVPTQVPEGGQAATAQHGFVLALEAAPCGVPVEKEIRRRQSEAADGAAQRHRSGAD